MTRAPEVSVTGSGPAVLLVPGGAARNKGYWLDVPEQLAAFSTVISFDRPGTGTTPYQGPRQTLAQQAERLAEVVKDVGVGPAVLVGHSLGGPVSIQLAADAPELVAGLVLLDPTPITSRKIASALGATLRLMSAGTHLPVVGPLLPKGMAASLRKQLKDVEWTPAHEVVAEVMADPVQIPQLSGLLRGLSGDAFALLERLRSQPLTVGGVLATAERKDGSPLRKAHVEMARLVGAELQVWEGTSHILHLQRPSRVVDTVRATLLG